MNEEVEHYPLGIRNMYSLVTRMACINLINAPSSQPILWHGDHAAFHRILTIMYGPPSELDFFHNHCTGREDESTCHLPHLVRVPAQLLTLYIC